MAAVGVRVLLAPWGYRAFFLWVELAAVGVTLRVRFSRVEGVVAVFLVLALFLSIKLIWDLDFCIE